MSSNYNNFKYDPYTIAAVLKAVHSFPAPSTDIPSKGIIEILRTGIEPALRETIEDARAYVIDLVSELALEEVEEGGFEAPSVEFIDELEDFMTSAPGQSLSPSQDLTRGDFEDEEDTIG